MTRMRLTARARSRCEADMAVACRSKTSQSEWHTASSIVLPGATETFVPSAVIANATAEQRRSATPRWYRGEVGETGAIETRDLKLPG